MSNHIPENAIAFGTASVLFAAFAYGNQRAAWEEGQRFDWENPEYRR